MKSLSYLFVFCGFVFSSAFGQVNLAPAAFKNAMENEAVNILLDVRQDWEFRKSHLPGAINIDFMADDFDTKISLLPKDVPVFVYCFSGGRSVEAAERLKSSGFKKVYNLTGGISAWEKAMLPVVR